MKDTQLFESVERELNRQRNNIELIASENFVSEEVLQLAGSVLTNKYAEGYPAKRYYGGCQFVDEVEELARQRICEIYGAEHANVQPHSGAQANTAVYLALLQHGDKVLGMSLADGGHLTHGHPLNFSGINYEFYSYGVSKETETIDYEAYKKQVEEIKPKLVVAGASAYSRTIDFEFMAKVAHDNGALFMVDMAHIAGLVAAGVHPSPFPYADIVTTTTHKTLRGPRGGVIMCKKEFAADIDRAVFPGMQGGPLMHIIAAKAQCFYEVQQPEFKDYAKQIIKNAKAMEKVFKEEGFRLVAGGTDNHLLLVDVKASCGISGKKAQRLLDEINITANKNAIPFDTEKPFKASGIRIGTPAMTTKGFKEEDFEEVARIIAYRLKNEETDEIKEECLKRVAKLTEKVTMYSNIKYIYEANMSVTILDHALIQHKLTIMRDKNTSTYIFKQNLDEIAKLMAFEVTRNVSLKDKAIETPVCSMVGKEMDQQIILAPILRAGIGLVDGFRDIIPTAKVGHIGMERDEETLIPREYYAKFPKGLEDALVIVLDPMLATGGSANMAIENIKQRGARKIKLVCLVGAPEGVKAIQEVHPDVDITLAALDEKLNEHGYIVPGLGDAGDRLFGTNE